MFVQTEKAGEDGLAIIDANDNGGRQRKCSKLSLYLAAGEVLVAGQLAAQRFKKHLVVHFARHVASIVQLR